MPVSIPFGPWRPDQPILGAGNSGEALNVVPAEGAYRPYPSLVTAGGTGLDAPCRGAQSFYRNDGQPYTFAGTETKLWRRETMDAFADVSGGTYDVPRDEAWRFERFGTKVYATNINDGLQVIDLETGVTFAAAPGSPPRARYIGRVRDFLFLGNVIEDALSKPAKVRWSAFNNPALWTPDEATQADGQELNEDLGPVRGIVGREFATIFHARGITRGDYIGPPTIFRFDVVEQARGLYAPRSLVSVGPSTYFLAEDGFHVWDGQSAQPIGALKVDRWFLDRMDDNSRGLVMAAHDPARHLVLFTLPTVVDADPSDLLAFNYRVGEWSRIEIGSGVDFFGTFAQRGYSLEELDQFGPLDDLPYSLDSEAWMRGKLQVAAFANDGDVYGTFTGPNLAATIETAEQEVLPGRVAFVRELRPLIEGADPALAPTAAVGIRAQRRTDALAWATATVQGVTGACPARATGRYARARVSIPAASTWTHAQGVQVDYRAAGRR